MRFNDGAYPLITKIGTGTLTLDAAQPATASYGAISVNGGRLVYSGSGQAFVSSAAANSVFNAYAGGTLVADNSGATNVNNRFGGALGGTLNVQGGVVSVLGSSAGATTESFLNLNAINGGGRIELTPGSGQALNFAVTNLNYAGATVNATTISGNANVTVPSTAGLAVGMYVSGNAAIPSGATITAITGATTFTLSSNPTAAISSLPLNFSTGTGSLVIAGLGNGANLSITNASLSAGQGGGANGSTNMSVRGDILADASVSGKGTGFLVMDTATNAWRALAANELNTAPTTWTATQNAGVTGSQGLLVSTSANTVTFSGTFSSLGASFSPAIYGGFGVAGDRLTLSLAGASAVLVTDGLANLTTGSVIGTAVTSPVFHVLAGATLNVTGFLGLNSPNGFVKADGGTMNLTAPSYAFGIPNGTVASSTLVSVNGGRLNLASGIDNTLTVVGTTNAATLTFLSVNGPSTIVDIGANSQVVRGLASSNILPGQGGTVTGSLGATLTTTDNSTFGGVLAGAMGFARSGNTTTILTSANTYTGPTAVRGGTLQLRDAGSVASSSAVSLYQGVLNWDNYGLNPVVNPARIGATAPVLLNGGTLTINGAGSVDTVVNLGTVTSAFGSNTLNTAPYINEGSTNVISVANFVRTTASGSMVNFNGWDYNNYSAGINTMGSAGLTAASKVFLRSINGTAFTAAQMTNNIVGGWAIADGSTFATYTDTYGLSQMGASYNGFSAPGFTGTDISAATVATGNYNDGAATRTVTGPHSAYTWRFSASTTQAYTFPTASPITLGVGIVTNNGNAITMQAADSTSYLTSAGSELFMYYNQGTLTLNMKLTGNMNVIRAGGGTFTMGNATSAGNNDYNGTTYLLGGTTNLSASGNWTLIPRDLVIGGVASGTNVTVTMNGYAQQIAAISNVTLNGGATLTLFGTNILNSLTFQNDGAMAVPTVATATMLQLSDANAITATNNSYVTTPAITGTALQFLHAAPVITVNAGLTETGLLISAPITQSGTMGSLTKAGAGVLALSGANTFSAPFNLNGGTLMIAGNTVLTGSVITSSPIGTGIFNIGAGTTLNTDGTARTLNNPVNVLGDFTFGGRLNGSNITLAAPVSLGNANRTITVTSPAVTATLNGVLTATGGSSSTGLTKAGNGILVLTGATTDASLGGAGVTVAAGLLRSGVLNAIPATSLLTVNAGAGFDLNGNSQTSNAIAGGGFFTNSSAYSPAILTVGSASDLTFAGSFGDNSLGGYGTLGLTKVGAGKLTLTSKNYEAGDTVISGGILELTADGSLGTSRVYINSGAVLRINRTADLSFTNSLNDVGYFRQAGNSVTTLVRDNTSYYGRFYVDAGTLQVGDGTFATTSANLGGADKVVIASGATLKFNVAAQYDSSISIEGAGDIVQQSFATLNLVPLNSAFTGGAYVNHGTMNVAGNATFAAATSIQVESGATFQIGAPGNVGTTTHGVALTLNGGTADATLYTGYLAGVTLNGGTLTSDSISSATPSWMLLGDVTVTDDSTISAYNVATNGASRDFNVSAGKRLWMTGSLVDMGPGQATGFTKSGAGDMILYTAAAFTGNVTVNGGSLRIEAIDGLLAPTTLTIGSAGTVSLSAGNFASSIGNSATGIVANINGLLDVRATGQAFLGAVQLGGGTISGSANGLVTLLGNVNATADSTISALNVSTAGVSRDFTVASGKTLTVSGALLDDSAYLGGTTFVKKGAGVMRFTGGNANEFTGSVEVAEGTLRVDDVGHVGAQTGWHALGDYTVGAAVLADTGATLALAFGGNYAFSNAVSGTGNLTIEGPGVVTMNSDNSTFTGVTTLAGGRTVISSLGVPTAGDLGSFGGADQTDASTLVFGGGFLEYTGSAHFTRKVTVANGGAGFYANASNSAPFLVDGTSQFAFDATTASARPLMLSGDSVLANKFTATALGSPAAGQAFSSIIKDGVGQWIIGGSGNLLNSDAEVSVNGGVLGFYLNGLGANGSTGNINLANNSTLRWESTNNQDVGSRLKVADGATATIKFDNTTSATTFANGFSFVGGPNTGTGSLVKSGAGELILAAANTFSGGLNVAEGKVTVNHASALGSAAATVSNTGTLVINQTVANDIHVTGNGTTGGTLVSATLLGNVDVGNHGTVARGASIGSFSATSLTLAGGARLEFKIWDITKAAGTGYDQYAFNSLDLSGASVSNKVVIKLVSMSDASTLGVAGNLSLLQGAAGIQHFSFGTYNTSGLNLGANTNVNDLFTFDTSQFTYTGGAASAASLWAIDFNSANGAITLTAVPEPSTYGIGLGALALAAAAIRRRRRQEKKA